MKLESDFKHAFLVELEETYPGIFMIKNDERMQQGIPDLLILYKNKWVMLEFKRATNSRLQANQDYFIDLFADMSYASFVYPENRERVLNEIQQTFRARR